MKILSRSLAILGLSLLAAIVARQSVNAQIVPLIDSGDTWQVLDNGSNLPNPAWLDVNYPDTASPWRALPGSFGYKVENGNWTENGALTKLNYSAGNNQPNAKYITTYFRKKITLTAAQVSGVTKFTTLLIGVRYDDGYVLYINGSEIKRENMPTGLPDGTTGASSAINVAANQTFSTFTISPGLLVVGSNTVAVELHQANNTSSDIFFELSLGASNLAPCFGDSTIGIYQDFESNLVELPASNHYGYLRDGTKTLLQFDAVANKRNANLPSGGLGVITPPVGDATKQLSFSKNVDFSFTTERIDTQNYNNVKASIGLRSAISDASWTTTDFIKGTIFYSTDGQTYATVPWFNYQTGTTTAVQTVILSETAPYFWMVPTVNTNPANTTTNPTDWFQVVPTGWTTYNTKPASWNNGNNGAGQKGGVGFDTNPTPQDYTPHLDAFNSPAIKTQMATNSRINVRVPFTMPNVPMANVVKVELILRFEDGIGVWLNGSQLTPMAPDPVFFYPALNTDYSPGRDDGAANSPYSYDITTVFKANVVPNSSNNILALRVCNVNLTSSDLIGTWKLVIHTAAVNPFSPAGIESTGTLSTVSTGTLIPQSVRSVKFRIEGTASSASAAETKAFFLDNFSVTGDPSAAVDLGSTLALQLPSPTYSVAQREQLADPDGDSIPNILEYAFGGNAAVSKRTTLLPNSSLQYLTPTILDAPDGYVRIQFRAIAGPYDPDVIIQGGLLIKDLLYLPQSSPDNQNWASTGEFLLDGAPVSNEDGTQTFTFKTQNQLVGQISKYFFRVRVEVKRDPWVSSGYNPESPCPFPE